MRDHYYELWDLEKNFGEKVMCKNTGSSKKNMNIVLESALLSNGAWGDRGTLDANKVSRSYCRKSRF